MNNVSAIIAGTAALLLTASPAIADPAAPPVKAAPAAATAADMKPGAPLRDIDSAPVGTIVSSTDQTVVVDTGQSKIGVPMTFFQKDDKGLLLKITAKQFSDAVAKAHARSQAAQAAQPQQSAPAPH